MQKAMAISDAEEGNNDARPAGAQAAVAPKPNRSNSDLQVPLRNDKEAEDELGLLQLDWTC